MPVTSRGLPRWLSGKKKICLPSKRHGFDPWIGKIPGKRKWQLTLVFLPGKFHGQSSLAGYNPWDCQESDATGHVSTHA